MGSGPMKSMDRTAHFVLGGSMGMAYVTRKLSVGVFNTH